MAVTAFLLALTMLMALPGRAAAAPRTTRPWHGVDTVERIAEAVNRDLNPGATARVPAAVIPRAQQVPDETLR
jgi:hypothetical protein